MALGPETETADVLRHWPSSGGLLLERADGGPNLGFQGVALLALRALRIEHDAGTAALISAIEHAKGVALRPSPTSGRTTRFRRGRGSPTPSAGSSRPRGACSPSRSGRAREGFTRMRSAARSPSGC